MTHKHRAELDFAHNIFMCMQHIITKLTKIEQLYGVF